MNEPMVSIIVPVYNVEACLSACLESIRRQTYGNIEVLVVDDGSTDGSAAICDEMAVTDGRFHIIHQKNTGVSGARNAAMDLASGKYIQFVDGDDRVLPEATETFVHAAETTGADMVLSRFYRVDGERRAPRGHIKGSRVLTQQEFAQEMMKAPANYYYGVLWNKFYRRTIVERLGLRFEPEMSWAEDFMFNLEYIRAVRLVAAISPPLYEYIKREGSLVNSHASLRRTIEMKRSTFECYKDLYQDLDLYEEQKAKVYCYLVATAVDGITLPGKGGPRGRADVARRQPVQLRR